MTDGLVVLDKEVGWTSHDVVAKLRGVYGQRKVGHSGTLDPGATGVLLIGLGRMTRLLRFLDSETKSYVGEVVLGIRTDTLDADGEVTATADPSGVTSAAVAAAAAALTGEIQQVPPMVSAVKVGGRRLHELAREGREVERSPRPVTVERFDVGPALADEPHVHPIIVECSSGTFVRTLADDLGSTVGCGAHLRNLRRTGIGPFTLEQAHTVGEVEADPTSHVVSPREALRCLPERVVDEETAARVAHGARLETSGFAGLGPGPWRVTGPDGALLAVYERHRRASKPAVVVAG